MKKIMFTAAAVLAAGIAWCGWTNTAKADAMLGGPYGPEGIRIPAAIELLADTPYYAGPDRVEAEGVFSPQTVKVIRTQAAWSTGSVSWEIETMYGPRWIRPNPWEIDIAPPERITLLEETPLYRNRSESGGPIAALSPQEVQVTGAEKQWFYTNDPNGKAWIQVHTSWLGEVWAHIPVNRIGMVQKSQGRAHFGSLIKDFSLPKAMGVSDGNSPQLEWVKGDFAIAGEFTTIYDRAFLVQTGSGTTWSQDKGITLIDTNETLDLTSETPLIADIWEGYKEIGLLKGEKVAAFEKVEQPLWTGRGMRELWYGGTWYHVRTSKGTGWVSLLYGEPKSAVPVHWKADIQDQRELERYPGVNFDTTTLLLRNQTVEATAAWDDPNGNKWLKVNVDGKSGWIALMSSGQDRVWDQEAGTDYQIKFGISGAVGVIPSDNGALNDFSGKKIGYRENGKDYLDATLVAGQLRYKSDNVSGADTDAIAIGKNDYSFQLKNGTVSTSVFWKGNLTGSVDLHEKARKGGDGALYLLAEDVRALFGLTKEFWTLGRAEYSLYEKEYTVDVGTQPVKAKNGRLELKAFLYEWVGKEKLDSSWQPLRMSLEEKGDRAADHPFFSEEPVISGTDAGQTAAVSLFRLNASRQLPSGVHQIDVILRSGERIVWKQTLNVAAE